jgi:hypothetical protein
MPHKMLKAKKESQMVVIKCKKRICMLKFITFFLTIFWYSEIIAQPLLISKNEFVKQEFSANQNLFCTTYTLKSNAIKEKVLLIVKFYNDNAKAISIRTPSITFSSVKNIINKFNNSLNSLKNHYPGKTNSYLFDSLIIKDKGNFTLYKGSVVVEIYNIINKDSNQVKFYEMNKNLELISSIVNLDSIQREMNKLNLTSKSIYSFKIDSIFLFWRTNANCKDCFSFHSNGHLFNKNFVLLSFYGKFIEKIPRKNISEFMQPDFYEEKFYWFLPLSQSRK